MDYNISPLWKEQHTFLKPVIFSPGQAFSGVNLKFFNQKKGDICFFNGKEWQVLDIGDAAQTLVVRNNLPSWGQFDVSNPIGILPVSSGGTGIGSYEPSSIIFSSSKKILSQLLIGKDNQFLTIKNQLLSWGDFPGVTGDGKSSYLAVWSSNQHVVASSIQVENDKISLKEKESSIQLGNSLISTSNDSLKIAFEKNEIILTKDTFSIQQNGKSVFKIWKNKLEIGVIPTSTISGVLSVAQGGTGLMQYGSGGILYADSNNTLAALSIDNSDGCYLKSVNGKPCWAPVNTIAASVRGNAFELFAGTQYEAPLLFKNGELLNTPNPGAMEWDGSKLFITNQNKKRQALVLEGDDINALAKGVSEIVRTDMGGTGKNLSNKPIGSVLFVDSDSSIGILSPSPDSFIKFDSNGLPSTSHAIVELTNGDGILVSSIEKNCVHITIDQTSKFNPIWSGAHVFEQGIGLGCNTILKLPSNTKSGLAQINFDKCQEPTQKQNGDVWFNDDLFVHVNGSTVNVTAEKNKHVQSQYLTIFSNVASDSYIKKIKYPLPYGFDGKSKIKWKLIRIDLRAEDSPAVNDAKISICANNNSVLEDKLSIRVGENSTNTQNFITPYLHSGDLISINLEETGGADCWSLYLTIEAIN